MLALACPPATIWSGMSILGGQFQTVLAFQGASSLVKQVLTGQARSKLSGLIVLDTYLTFPSYFCTWSS